VRPFLHGSSDVLDRTNAFSRHADRALTIGLAHPAFAAVGGAEVLLSRYAEHLASVGHKVRVVTKRFDASAWSELAAHIEAIELPNSWTDHLGIPGTHPEVMRRVARHVEALRSVDVVIGGNFPGNAIAAAVGESTPSVWACMEPSRRLYPSQTLPTLTERLRRMPAAWDSALMKAMRVVIEQDLAGGRKDANAAQRCIDQTLVPKLSRIITISEFTAANVKRIFGRVADHTIPPTVHLPARIRRVPGVTRDGLRVLVHGRMELLKNAECAIRGFAQFASRRSGDHELHVVGDGPDLARLKGLALELGVGHIAKFHGFLHEERLRVIYARCDVMASLPVDEPFGMVFPEAALRGLLLIGPDHAGPREILDDGRFGWCVDAFNPDAVGDALNAAWSLPISEVERRRERAAVACAQRYGPEATLPAFEKEILAACSD
jgi:glycosyltransferase involved in cell wall biosynthesis